MNQNGQDGGTTTASPGTIDVLRHQPVRAIFTSLLVSSIAVAVLTTALGWQVYEITDRKLDLGFLGLAEFAPAAVLVLVTGGIADRHDRKRVYFAALAVEILAILALFAYARTGPTAVGPLYALVVVFGAARAFASPATRPLVPVAAPPGGLARTIALSSLCWQVSAIFGPLAAGLLYDAHGAPVTYAVSVALLLCAGLSMSRFPSSIARRHIGSEATERPTLHSAFEGLRVIRREPILLGAISLDLFAVLFGGAVALLPALVKDVLHLGVRDLGWIRFAGGAGAALMALLMASRPVTRQVGRVLLVVVGVFGLGTIVLGLTKSLWLACAAMFVLNAADSVSVYIRGTLVPLVTPEDKRGRVTAVEGVFIGASNELGGFESGVAATLLGTVGAIVSGGIATLAVVVVSWFVFPALRDVDRFEDLERPHHAG